MTLCQTFFWSAETNVCLIAEVCSYSVEIAVNDSFRRANYMKINRTCTLLNLNVFNFV